MYTIGAVAEADVDDLLLLAGEIHGLGRGVDDVAPIAGQLLDDVGALFQPGYGKRAIFRGLIGADHSAARAGGVAGQVADLEHGPLDGHVGVLGIILPHADGG